MRMRDIDLPLVLTFCFLCAKAAANESMTLPPPLGAPGEGDAGPGGEASAPPGRAALLSLTRDGSTFFKAPIPPAF
jgi:hypothetical protein